MKKITASLVALTMVLVFTGCESGKTEETTMTRLGTSAFSIVLPEGYAVAQDDLAEDQIAYYYKDDDSIDFDVYQWSKSEENTLESEAEYYSAEYGTTYEMVAVNGIDCAKYISEEEYEGGLYTVINYMFEDENSIVELCFWTVGEEEYADVDEIIDTLKKE